ncbi:MAG: hypothetical protein SFW67_25380 [Myxococcaceae bacterium]|nr:hypothetical protein [Myxococcaceae bacterium]
MPTRSSDERDSFEVLTELFARDVDGALLDENLKLTPEQRLLKLAVLDGLERSKKAAGRPKDLVDLGSIAELKQRRG